MPDPAVAANGWRSFVDPASLRRCCRKHGGDARRARRGAGGCERIASTPPPFTYSVIPHRSSSCVLHHAAIRTGRFDRLDDAAGGRPCPTFFALEALGDEIEEPFGMMPNDLALDAIVSGIEASLRGCSVKCRRPRRGPTPTSFSLDGARCSLAALRLKGSGA